MVRGGLHFGGSRRRWAWGPAVFLAYWLLGAVVSTAQSQVDAIESGPTEALTEPGGAQVETLPPPQPTVPSSPWISKGLDSLRKAVGAPDPSSVQAENTAVAPESQELPAADEAQTAVDGSKQHLVPIGDSAAKDLVVEGENGLISLMVRDAPLRQVVALIAETQNLNIVFASPAEVPVTASFDRVPWQRVMEALLSISGHTWTVNQGIVFVTNIEAADFVSPEAGGRIVEVFELDFASAVDVNQTVVGLLSPAGKSWLVETSNEDNHRTRDTVAVIDYPANIMRISDYICRMDVPPRQVLIEANILQIELDDECRNGLNYEALSSFRGNELKFSTVGMANSTASPSFFLDVTGHALEGLVELLKTTTDAKSLASPKLLAVSGQQARIQIGSQLGFRVTTTTQTSTLESIQFLDVGVVLTVTPRITRDGRVLMRIKPEVSTGQVDATTGLPSEETTEVETDILLNDGQGMVIGGLIQELDSNKQSKIPWIGDLPYVGFLFQKRSVVKKRSEIVVTLMPHIQPYSPDLQHRESAEFQRTQDRLLYGPLDRVQRPYEARLPDTFSNPIRPVASLLACDNQCMVPTGSPIPVQLPPIESESTYENQWLPPVESGPEITFPDSTGPPEAALKTPRVRY